MNSSKHQSEIPDYLRQLADPWRAMTDMWVSWSEAIQAGFKERGEKASELLTRAWSLEFWRAGEFAPFIDELQGVFSLPRFADVPNVDLSALKPAASMLELAKLHQQYLAVSIPLWLAISRRFQAELAVREKSGEPVKSPGAALDLWNSAVDGTLMEFTRGRPGRLAGITVTGQELSRPFAHLHSDSRLRPVAGRGKRICGPFGEERRPSHVASHERSDARVSNYGTNHPCRRYRAGPRRSCVEASIPPLGDVDVKNRHSQCPIYPAFIGK